MHPSSPAADMGWPPVTLGAQATRSQSQICDSSRNVLPSPGSLARLTDAPSPTVSRYLENTPASKSAIRYGEHRACRSEGSGQPALGQWKHQRPEDEQWHVLFPKSSSRATSKTTAAIEESLKHIHLSEPGHREHGGRKAGECSGPGNAEPRSSTKAGDQNRKSSSGSGRRSYAEVARRSNSSRVKHGQLLWSVKVASFLACFCCKWRVLMSYSNSPRTQPDLCQCVKDERTCRRGSAGRHIAVGSTLNDGGYISLQQYEELNGNAYQHARDSARDNVLLGRARDKYLWREGFVFLYPIFEGVKEILDPYGYDTSFLDVRILQAIENERRRRRQRQQYQAGSQTVDRQVSDSDHTVAAAAHRVSLPITHNPRNIFSRASEPVIHQIHPQVSSPSPRSYANAVAHESYDSEPNCLYRRSAALTQPQPFPQYHSIIPQGHSAIEASSSGYQDQYAQDGIRQPDEVRGNMIQPVLPRSFESGAPYRQPAPSYIRPHGEVRRQMPCGDSSNGAIHENHLFVDGPWTHLGVRGGHPHDGSIQSPGPETWSSAHQTTPGMTHELSSTRTGSSSLLRPPTPATPETPTPQSLRNVLPDLSSGSEIPLRYIDPRILDINYRMEDFDHDARS